MKNFSIARGFAGLQAFVPSYNRSGRTETNEIRADFAAAPVIMASITERPRILSKRLARQYRRASH